jgi:phosphoserine phosphatase RsbU/P
MTLAEATNTKHAIIRAVFEGLADPEVEALSASAVEKSYPAGTILCREGNVESTFYIIIEGNTAITRRLQDGGTRQLSQRKAGEFFGEMALIERKPRAATVVTTTETTVLEVSEQDFNGLLISNPKVALSLLRGITATLRASDQASIADLSRQNMELARAYADLKAAQEQLVNKEKLEHELDIAARLQQGLLPKVFPKVNGWSFDGRNSPARTIGGDLYDVIPVDDEHVALLMADVSDKSIHAALFMAVTRSLFIPESRRSLSPRTVAMAVHHWLLQVSSDDNMFVTAFYGVLTPATGRLRYVRAGQDRPIWLRHGESEYTELDAAGRFLGMLDELELEEKEVWLKPGDMLVMYSDGIPDAINEAGDNYGLERLVELVSKNRETSAKGIVDTIFGDVFEFRGNAQAFDDITVLVAKADER